MQSMEWISKSLLILPVEDLYWIKNSKQKGVSQEHYIQVLFKDLKSLPHTHNLENKITWNHVCELINETWTDNNAIRRKSLYQKNKTKQKTTGPFLFPLEFKPWKPVAQPTTFLLPPWPLPCPALDSGYCQVWGFLTLLLQGPFSNY